MADDADTVPLHKYEAKKRENRALKARVEELERVLAVVEPVSESACDCSYGSRHGTREYRSCMGDRCRNEDHTSACSYRTCIACFGSDDDS